jgi:hypothetical protein
MPSLVTPFRPLLLACALAFAIAPRTVLGAAEETEEGALRTVQATPPGPTPGAIGRGVQPHTARPRLGPSGYLPSSALIPIGRETGEEDFRDLKLRGADPRTLGGRERTLDAAAAAESGETRASSLESSFAGLDQYASTPYDAAMAVGPTQVLVMTNNQFGIFDKATGAQLGYGLYIDFFGNAAGGGFDPKCFYDAAAGRFVMTVIEAARNPNRSLIDVAVSQTSDATGAWHVYAFDGGLEGNTPTGTWSDYPGLGYDDAHVYYSTNQYEFTEDWLTDTFSHHRIRCWSKQELYSGGPAGSVDFSPVLRVDHGPAFATKPARSLVPTSTGRFLATRPGGNSYVTLWETSGTYPNIVLGSPQRVNVGAYGVGKDAPQPGTSIRIDTGDCRTQDVVWRNGYHVGFTERSPLDTNLTAVRYLHISDAGDVLRDISYEASGRSYFYPGVTVDPAGNVAMVFGVGSGSEYASLYQTRMPAGGSFEPSQLVRSGTGTNLRQRWGDYHAAVNDPLDPGLVWIYGGFASLNDRWSTHIGSVRPATSSLDVPGREAPSSDDLLVPAVTRGRTPIEFTLGSDERIELALYDVTGRAIRVLASGRHPGGRQAVEWDGRDGGGAAAPAGIYWVRLLGERASLVRRLVVLR